MTSAAPVPASIELAARTLQERIATSTLAVAAPADGERTDDVALRWRQVFDLAKPERFDRRLRWDNLDHSVLGALSQTPVAPTGPAEWTALLAEVCATAGEFDQQDSALDSTDPIAFEEVLLPFVRVARRRLQAAAPSVDRVIAPAARAQAERALLSELSAAAGQALLADFGVARVRRGRLSLGLGAPGRAAYSGFVNALLGSHLEPLVTRYPVLARVLSVRTTFWVSAFADLVKRAEDDAERLAALFGTRDLGRIVGLGIARGDSHAAGRTVAAVRFESGLEVMYKPRPMVLDQAFYGLLTWLHERGLKPDQRLLRVLDRGTYGWVEFVRPAPLESEADVRAYYERAGALLCLCYVLGAGDLHPENIIAAGPYPVPVDLEMVMWSPVSSPVVDGWGRASTADQGKETINVLSNLLLPYWSLSEGRPFLFGGGFGLENTAARSVEQEWLFTNTDRMQRATCLRGLDGRNNVPRCDDRVVPPAERVEDIVRGFELCHETLEVHRPELCAPLGPLDRFRGQRARVLLRNSDRYGAVLRRSLHPLYLQDGLEHSLQLEALRVGVLGYEEPLSHWAAFASEQHDLENLDYPLFWAFTDGTTLHDSQDRQVGTYCSSSPYQAAIDRLARLDAGDRRYQSSLIRFIYVCASGPVATVRRDGHGAASQGECLDAPTALAEARAIADALEALIVRDSDGSPQWVGLCAKRARAGMSLHPLNDSLYDGRAGVALFLSALDALAGTGHTELAAESLKPLRQMIRSPRECSAVAGQIGVGAGLGMGGLSYTFTQLWRFTGDESWLRDAVCAAQAITPNTIATDPVIDVLGGVAGALLALLALHNATGEPWVLERAQACGRRLLAAATVEPQTQRRAWQQGTPPFCTGFAHGAGGIAVALERLAAVTGVDRFGAAAEEGFRFEECLRNLQSPAAPHLVGAATQSSRASIWWQTWCNGPVGVAIGRSVHGSRVLDDVSAPEDLEATLSPDHICCGSLGRAELLLVTGRSDRARALAGKLVARARDRGSYQISSDVPDARCTPSFFQGLSGIGYQLLRIAHPSAIPSVLAFE